MNFIDTDLWHKRAPGEIRGSATAADESEINVLFACISEVYERRFEERYRVHACPSYFSAL